MFASLILPKPIIIKCQKNEPLIPLRVEISRQEESGKIK